MLYAKVWEYFSQQKRKKSTDLLEITFLVGGAVSGETNNLNI